MDSRNNINDLSRKKSENILSHLSNAGAEGWQSNKFRLPFSSGSGQYYTVIYHSILTGIKAVGRTRLYALLIISALALSAVFTVIKSEKFFSFSIYDKSGNDYNIPVSAASDEAIPEVNIIDRTPPVVSDCFEEYKGPRYELTEAERDVVERVVMAEAGGEGYHGQKLIAKCILNSAEKLNISPADVVVELQYTKARPEPSDQVKQAVSAVFDIGERVSDDLIMYFYNPDKCESVWHEEQVFVIEYGGHRFFSER